MSAFDYDEDDDRPRRRRREDDDEYVGRRSSRYEDERDDYDDMPTRRRGGPGDALALWAMIIGIVAAGSLLPGCCCGLLGGVSFVGGVASTIMGFQARSRGSESPMALVGIILGILAALVGLAEAVYFCVSFYQGFQQGMAAGANPPPPGPGPGKNGF